MKTPALNSYEIKNASPILIVDKIGVIGQALAIELSRDFLIVFASSLPQISNEKIIHIPFRKKIPEVPDSRYSKIFIVDDGESVTRESAFSFIKIARESNCPLFFIGSVRNIDVSHADEITTSYTNAKVLIFGDLFDKKIFFDRKASVNKFLLQARRNGKIEIGGNGLSLSFPISFIDSIKLIIKASYIKIPQKIILLFYPHPITDISLAHLFQKINPNIKVDFTKEKESSEIYIPQGAQHAISKYSLEEKIRELNIEDPENRQVRVVSPKNPRSGILRPIFLSLAVFLFLLLLPLITTSFYSILGIRAIEGVKKSLEDGSFDIAVKQAKNSETFFETAEKTLGPLTWEANLIGQGKRARDIAIKLETGKSLSRASIYLLEGADQLKNVYSGKSLDPKGDFSRASNSLKSAVSIIEKIRAQGELPNEFKAKYENIEPFVDLFSNSSEILPDILGFEKEKTYLVLFQNNMELRPGGGFIGSYGILKVKNAKMTQFKIEDVYQTDGQLKAHIEPPFAIRRYLPSVHLYMRDSNFDPDFVKSAISASSIYSLVTKNKVDGVIGIDLFFAKNIVSALGPIDVPNYNKKIDENNLYSVTEQQAEKNFFAGSTQKKDFLSALAKSIQSNLENRKNIPYFLLAQNVGKSIIQKHLLFAFENQDYQDVFSANGWSSTLTDNRVQKSNKINDYLGISEANLGVNKVNYFISRSVSKRVILSGDGEVRSTVTVAYKNNSLPNSVNGGGYKNYLQLILPQGSSLDMVSIDGKEQKTVEAVTDYFKYEAKNFVPPPGVEIEQTDISGKSIFGLLVNVPAGKVKTISIAYTLPYSLTNAEKSIDYSLLIYKQPGIDSYPFDFGFSGASSYNFLNYEKPYSIEISKDLEIDSTITQN